MDRGAWQASVHGVTKSWLWLSDYPPYIKFPTIFPSQVVENIVKNQAPTQYIHLLLTGKTYRQFSNVVISRLTINGQLTSN